MLLNMSDTDLELIRRYAYDRAEDAFAELVRRHLNLVYSAALRQVRSPQLAEEVAQSAFTDLAHNAARLKPGTIVTAWLYQVTRRTAIDVVRREARRQLREQIATEMNALNASGTSVPPVWSDIEPLLDEAMSELDETDRAAVLLRYFENKSLREVGQTLGTSDDAAQKRVSRAVERLREFFVKRGISFGAGGFVAVVSANAVQAAPVGLAVTICTAATAATVAGAAVATTATATITKAIVMTTLQKTLVTATVAILAGAGIYEARQATVLRTQVQTLQLQHASLADQLHQLQRVKDGETKRLAAAEAENERLKSGHMPTELLRLRSKVTLLQNAANDPTDAAAKELLARVDQLKRQLEQTPSAGIPELQLLSEQDWLTASKGWNLDSESGVRNALSGLRGIGEQKFSNMTQAALAKFSKANNQPFPTDLSQLQPYFDSPVDAAILRRWEILPAGATMPGIGNQGPFVTQKAPVDDLLDRRWAIGTWGSACTDFLNSEIQAVMIPVYKAYAAANNGVNAGDPADYLPFATTSEQQAAVQKLLQQAAARK